MFEKNNQITVEIECSSDLLKYDSVIMLKEIFLELVQCLVGQPDTPLKFILLNFCRKEFEIKVNHDFEDDNIAKFLNYLEKIGVTIKLDNDKLKFSGQEQLISQELILKLKKIKNKL